MKKALVTTPGERHHATQLAAIDVFAMLDRYAKALIELTPPWQEARGAKPRGLALAVEAQDPGVRRGFAAIHV